MRVSFSKFFISKALEIKAIFAFCTLTGMSILTLDLSMTIPLISSVFSTLSDLFFSILIFVKSIPLLSFTCLTASTIMSANISFTVSAAFPVIAVIAIYLKISSLESETSIARDFKIS